MKNAILYFHPDKEDGGMLGKMALECTKIDTYEDAFNELKSKLESKEFVDFVIEEFYVDDVLRNNIFDGEEVISFSFKRVTHEYSLCFVFEVVLNVDDKEMKSEWSLCLHEDFIKIL